MEVGNKLYLVLHKKTDELLSISNDVEDSVEKEIVEIKEIISQGDNFLVKTKRREILIEKSSARKIDDLDFLIFSPHNNLIGFKKHSPVWEAEGRLLS